MTRREIDLANVDSVGDFHSTLARHLDLGPYYGRNSSALWDAMTTDVERPVTIIFRNARRCRAKLGADYEKIIGILRKAAERDVGRPAEHRLVLEVRED